MLILSNLSGRVFSLTSSVAGSSFAVWLEKPNDWWNLFISL